MCEGKIEVEHDVAPAPASRQALDLQGGDRKGGRRCRGASSSNGRGDRARTVHCSYLPQPQRLRKPRQSNSSRKPRPQEHCRQTNVERALQGILRWGWTGSVTTGGRVPGIGSDGRSCETPGSARPSGAADSDRVRLRRVSRRVRSDAEDITSDVFERALRYRSSYDPKRGEPVAWLIGIARRCIDGVVSDPHRALETLEDSAAPGDLAEEPSAASLSQRLRTSASVIESSSRSATEPTSRDARSGRSSTCR